MIAWHPGECIRRPLKEQYQDRRPEPIPLSRANLPIGRITQRSAKHTSVVLIPETTQWIPQSPSLVPTLICLDFKVRSLWVIYFSLGSGYTDLQGSQSQAIWAFFGLQFVHTLPKVSTANQETLWEHVTLDSKLYFPLLLL